MKILVLNLTPNTIGDNLFLTPMFKILKKSIKKLTLHTTVSTANTHLFENNPNIDKLYSYDELKIISQHQSSKFQKIKQYLKLCIKIIKLMKKEKYDLCIITQPNFFISQLLPNIGGIKRRIGYKYKKSFFSFLLTDKVPFQDIYEQKTPRHYTETVLDLVKPLQINYSKKDMKVELKVKNTTLLKIKETLKTYRFKNFICIQPGGKDPKRYWPKEKFKELVFKLISKNQNVIILGSENEKELGEFIKNNIKSVINLCGKTNIEEASALLNYAKLSICNDSGLAHISSALGVTTAIIYGSSTPLHSEPRGKGKIIKIYTKNIVPEKLIKANEQVLGKQLMNRILVDDVFEKIKREL